MKDLLKRDIGDITAALEQGEVEPRDVVAAALYGLGRERLNAVIETRSQAVEEAGGEGPLAGVPVLVKDCFVDDDRPPTVGSRLTATWLTGTAEVLSRLRAAGAAIVGYSNLHEWMVGTTSLVSAFGPVTNPIDPALIAGGSSGGSAAAVAAGLVPAAVGTDAGGSIRIPAACCGVAGFKPTWGVVPTGGFVDEGSPIDHVGPIARTVADVTRLFEVMAGVRVESPPTGGLRIGIAREFLDGAAPEVADATRAVARALERHCAEVGAVDLPSFGDARWAVGRFLLRDVAANLAARDADWATRLEGDTAAVLLRGAAMDEAERTQAEDLRSVAIADWERVFAHVDVVVTPTLPDHVARISERHVSLRSGSAPVERAYVSWNAPMNLAGVPSLSVPVPGGRPFSVSLTAARGRDDLPLAVGALVERLGRADR